jgi:hypothetical protein
VCRNHPYRLLLDGDRRSNDPDDHHDHDDHDDAPGFAARAPGNHRPMRYLLTGLLTRLVRLLDDFDRALIAFDEPDIDAATTEGAAN